MSLQKKQSKAKINKDGYIKPESFYTARESLAKIKRKPTKLRQRICKSYTLEWVNRVYGLQTYIYIYLYKSETHLFVSDS